VLIDARRLQPDSTVRCEVCVVGTGAAGTTAALELAEKGHDVVLLEGGAVRRTRDRQETYEGEVESSGLDGSTHPPLETTRVKKLGGTTGAWGGRCAPLDAIDFERRDFVDASGWPISRSSLDPFYARATTYCEAGEPEYTSAEALPGSGNFLLHDEQQTELDDGKVLRYSRPTDFGKTYRQQLERSPIVRCLHHANVLRFELDTAANVEAAIVASSPGREFRVTARFFVIAAGGLETARLLLESERYRRQPICAGHDLIGRYYMTHLDALVGSCRFRREPPPAAYTYELSRDGVYCRRLICLTAGAQQKHELLNFSAVLYMPPPDDPSHGDGLLSTFAVAKDLLYRFRIGFKARRHGMEKEPIDYPSHARNIVRNPWGLPLFTADWTRRRWLASRKLPSFLVRPSSGEFRLLVSAEQSPVKENRVLLSDDQWDAFGVPRLKVMWSVRPQDYESIVGNLEVVANNFRALDIGSLEIAEDVDGLMSEMGGGFLGGTHAMGTARMSATPRTGVVDGECRVHGVNNLYIASSAVFPTGGFAAPTLTIVALSVRIADKIHAESSSVALTVRPTENQR